MASPPANSTPIGHDNPKEGPPNVRTDFQLAFHGAAANSCPHSLLWVRAPTSHPTSSPSATTADDVNAPQIYDTVDNELSNTSNGAITADTIIYASSGVVNLATAGCLARPDNNDGSTNNNTNNSTNSTNSTNSGSTIMSVTQTLITRTIDHSSSNSATKKVLARGEAVEDAAAPRSITALAWVSENRGNNKDGVFGIVAAFSDGTVTSWRWNCDQSTPYSETTRNWQEHVIFGHDPSIISPSHESSPAPSVNKDGNDIPQSSLQESIADISATCFDKSTWLVATASSTGVFLHISSNAADDKSINNPVQHSTYSRRVNSHASSSVHLTKHGWGVNKNTTRECFLFAGSASPRHNKVWVYTIPYHETTSAESTVGNSSWAVFPTLTVEESIYHGHLSGHQDWITCFAWMDHFNPTNDSRENYTDSLLASSGHDAKIRLWKFSSCLSSAKNDIVDGLSERIETMTTNEDDGVSDDSDDEDEANIDDLEEEEGESRLTIQHSSTSGYASTAVFLEALLLGHEEAVTSLMWRGGKSKKDVKPCLLSSSLDRTILLWMEEEYTNDDNAVGGAGGGVWVPISRVGSAGGILGGPVGCSLMGFVQSCFSPDASRIAGHGYGGSLHFWTQFLQTETLEVKNNESDEAVEESEEKKENEEEELMSARWIADPCITGHFRSVEDMSWDSDGEYLLTVGGDQTVRLWAQVPVSNASSSSSHSTTLRWVEVGRPQVHGYDMTSIVCIGRSRNNIGSNDGVVDGEPPHRFVSGADEKVLRVFDAPSSTLRNLQLLKQLRQPNTSLREEESGSWRVERAFLPSLGLSNKATEDTDAKESSKYAGPSGDDAAFGESLDKIVDRSTDELKLPLERDLGASTLWPETRKLFGHESELVCLDAYRRSSGRVGSSLVASSCRARNDIASAAIRLWNVNEGKCVGILKGGHRSTVSTMSFSKDGKYLVGNEDLFCNLFVTLLAISTIIWVYITSLLLILFQASSGKDRRICIWKRANDNTHSSTQEEGGGYELSAAADSAHKRIVWSVNFHPAQSDTLVSGSRDGFVKIWNVSEADESLDIKEMWKFEPSSKSGKKSEPVTAVAFAEAFVMSNESEMKFAILGVGTESGRIEIWSIPMKQESVEPKLLCLIPFDCCHFDTVKKISWRPVSENTGGTGSKSIELTLASCSQDCGVRIFNFTIEVTQ